MSPILTRLRSMAGANSGHYECCLSIQEVREIVKAWDRHLEDKRIGYEATNVVLSLCQHTPHEWLAMSKELRDFQLKVFGLLDLPCAQLGNDIRQVTSPAEVNSSIDSMGTTTMIGKSDDQ